MCIRDSREAARRTVCANNLAQLGLAVHNYEFAREHLPAGVTDTAPGPILTQPTGIHVGFLVSLLPQLEQRGIAKNFDVKLGTYAKANAPARMVPIRSLICPSSGIFEGVNVAGDAGVTSYAGCHNGTEVSIDSDNNGVLFLNSKITYGDIYDGSSNTILIGEMIPAADTLGWASGTRASLRNTGSLMDTMGVRGMAPLAPHEVGGFASDHPGTIMVCLTDGSVQALGFGVDTQLLENLGNREDGAMMGGFDW